MRILLLLIFSCMLSYQAFNQNVGEKGNKDSLINYTDIQGNKQGKWTKNYKSGVKAYEATFVNNKLVGEYKRYFTTGTLMAHINYNKTGDEGYAKIFYDTGGICGEGKYIKQNVRDSIWKYYGTDGKLLSEVSYKSGKADGPSKSYFRNGKVSEIVTFKDSIRDGLWRRYYEEGGTEMETMHVKGKRHGVFNVFYYNGQIKIKGRYANDLPSGKWIFYNQDGTLEKELEYTDKGRLVNQDEVDAEFAKQVLEWDKLKGTIPEPSEKSFFKGGQE